MFLNHSNKSYFIRSKCTLLYFHSHSFESDTFCSSFCALHWTTMQLSPNAHCIIVTFAQLTVNLPSHLSALSDPLPPQTPRTIVAIIILSFAVCARTTPLILYHFPRLTCVSHIFIGHNKPIFHKQKNPQLYLNTPTVTVTVIATVIATPQRKCEQPRRPPSQQK